MNNWLSQPKFIQEQEDLSTYKMKRQENTKHVVKSALHIQSKETTLQDYISLQCRGTKTFAHTNIPRCRWI